MIALRLLPCALLLIAGAAHAQDERTILSPDGQMEFRLFTATPDGSNLNCLAYQVWSHGKQLLDTSYLGLNIHFQEPLLGENVGLSADKKIRGEHYNGLFADYLQTSTTGRRIQIEIRVWNDAVAFRYTVPTSGLLVNLLLEDDATQFRFAQSAAKPRPQKAKTPYEENEASGGWIGIYDQPTPGFPPLELTQIEPNLLIAHLQDKPHDPGVAYEGKTPWTSPWRIIVTADTREALAKSQALREISVP